MITEFKQLDELKNLNVSIKEASIASNRNSLAMNCLTGALVLLGLVQVIVACLDYHSEQKIVETRKQCYRSVLQTSDFDLNYKSCLRDHGLSN